MSPSKRNNRSKRENIGQKKEKDNYKNKKKSHQTLTKKLNCKNVKSQKVKKYIKTKLNKQTPIMTIDNT